MWRLNSWPNFEESFSLIPNYLTSQNSPIPSQYPKNRPKVQFPTLFHLFFFSPPNSNRTTHDLVAAARSNNAFACLIYCWLDFNEIINSFHVSLGIFRPCCCTERTMCMRTATRLRSLPLVRPSRRHRLLGKQPWELQIGRAVCTS